MSLVSGALASFQRTCPGRVSWPKAFQGDWTVMRLGLLFVATVTSAGPALPSAPHIVDVMLCQLPPGQM